MTFNELFNEYFKKNPKKTEADKIINMIQDIGKMKDSKEDEEAIDNKIIETLGKPNEIQYYNKGDVFFEKRIWHTLNGDIVKVIMTDDPTLVTTPPAPLSLEEKLRIAIEEEHYELAVKLRDEIKNKSK